jgi:two-component system OmpR family response regulator
LVHQDREEQAVPIGSSTSSRILVVDDEASIVDSVSTILRYEGFEVDVASSGRAALQKAQETAFDLIVLDVMLPDLDGLEVTRRIRGDGLDVPILFLTAKSEVADRVAGLTVGGDDYVSKPFSLVEIVARTKAILRRRQPPGDDRRLQFADLVMDEESHEVWRGGVPVNLTATEFNLLRLFLLNPRHVLSKDQIIDHVWHYDFGGNQNIVETYVRYLRKKLNALGPPVIHTIRLVGYVMREGQ